MNPFRRVDDRLAGPEALGILVPPGQKTLVIVRPRALPWDLLTVRPEEQGGAGPIFAAFSRDEAALVARTFQQWLEQSASETNCPVKVEQNLWGEGFIVSVQQTAFVWIACLRQPGKPYQAIVFSEREEAESAASLIAKFLYPGPKGNQEYYFNTQHFH